MPGAMGTGSASAASPSTHPKDSEINSASWNGVVLAGTELTCWVMSIKRWFFMGVIGRGRGEFMVQVKIAEAALNHYFATPLL